MSEATDRPADDDAWAQACAEDLAAEKARRRAEYGPPPGSAAEELRKLVDAVADKVSSSSRRCSALRPRARSSRSSGRRSPRSSPSSSAIRTFSTTSPQPAVNC